MQVLDVTKRDSPLVLSMPHAGTVLPKEVEDTLNDRGRALADTDWWIDRLYNFASDLGASIVKANLSRYVIDLNRNPAGHSLYPGQATTELCPTTTFDGEPIYEDVDGPSEAEIERRRISYFVPYHEALEERVGQALAIHGYALLYDCHSICSQVPRLFDGTLPTINLGTNDGASCGPAIEDAVNQACASQNQFSFVANGRFKGGWITRKNGRPDENVHALQVELAQSAYMEEAPPWTFVEERADQLRVVLRQMLTAYMASAAEACGSRT